LPRFPHPSARPAHKPRGSALPVAPPNEAASFPASCIFRLCRRLIFELPRISYPSAHPALRLQVAPKLCTSSCACRCVPRVAPASASSGLAGDGSSSRLEFRILQHIRRSGLEFPPKLAPPIVPADESPGFPGFCIFRLCRQRIFELPRISRPSVPLAQVLRVAPRHRSSSCASRCGCEFPRFLHLPALPRVQVSGFPRNLSPSAPAGGFPSCLGSRTLRLCRPCVFGLPRILHLRLGQ
jgi:hypothetical protein